MRHCSHLILLFLIASLQGLAQGSLEETDLTGLWKGNLYNDTTKMFYRYEIGISKAKGKLHGFSHTWFILDDKQYFGVKKVKVRIKGNKLVVEDDGLISNNYPVAPAKGVKQLNILELEITGNTMSLTGPFTTNRTKEYRPLTGSIKLERTNDHWQSALVPHLEELQLISSLSFIENDVVLSRKQQELAIVKLNTDYRPEPRNIITPTVQPDRRDVFEAKKAEEKKQEEPVKNAAVVIAKAEAPVLSATISKAPTAANENSIPVKAEANVPKTLPVSSVATVGTGEEKSVVATNKVSNTTTSVPAPAPEKKATLIATNTALPKSVEEKKATTAAPITTAAAPVNPVKATVVVEKPIVVVPVASDEKNVSAVQPVIPVQVGSPVKSPELAIKASNAPAAQLATRFTMLQQTVSFKSDSLQITLYDNGEVDGDTVSVIMNGEIIMARQGLSTNAVRKTIYIDPGTDSVQLVMYAENLGSIAPNTGLLVVRDGRDLYEIRFSGDLQKNAAILFRRKR